MLACSWSGGKDGCFAYWKTINDGHEIGCLLNTYRAESNRVAFHGVRSKLIVEQARSIGVPLLQIAVAGEDYESQFLAALRRLKRDGFGGIVFGDIDVKQNRDWCEYISRKAGLDAYFPLWNMDQKTILKDFVRDGFKAVIAALNSQYLKKEDLGRSVDLTWIQYIDSISKGPDGKTVTYCGENGEYHTYVYYGPIFNKPVSIRSSEIVSKQGYWLLDLEPVCTIP